MAAESASRTPRTRPPPNPGPGQPTSLNVGRPAGAAGSRRPACMGAARSCLLPSGGGGPGSGPRAPLPQLRAAPAAAPASTRRDRDPSAAPRALPRTGRRAPCGRRAPRHRHGRCDWAEGPNGAGRGRAGPDSGLLPGAEAVAHCSDVVLRVEEVHVPLPPLVLDDAPPCASSRASAYAAPLLARARTHPSATRRRRRVATKRFRDLLRIRKRAGAIPGTRTPTHQAGWLAGGRAGVAGGRAGRQRADPATAIACFRTGDCVLSALPACLRVQKHVFSFWFRPLHFMRRAPSSRHHSPARRAARAVGLTFAYAALAVGVLSVAVGHLRHHTLPPHPPPTATPVPLNGASRLGGHL